jgi:hypothetical protein
MLPLNCVYAMTPPFDPLTLLPAWLFDVVSLYISFNSDCYYNIIQLPPSVQTHYSHSFLPFSLLPTIQSSVSSCTCDQHARTALFLIDILFSTRQSANITLAGPDTTSTITIAITKFDTYAYDLRTISITHDEFQDRPRRDRPARYAWHYSCRE